MPRLRWRNRVGAGLRSVADALDPAPRPQRTVPTGPAASIPSVGTPGVLDLDNAPADWARRVRGAAAGTHVSNGEEAHATEQQRSWVQRPSGDVSRSFGRRRRGQRREPGRERNVNGSDPIPAPRSPWVESPKLSATDEPKQTDVADYAARDASTSPRLVLHPAPVRQGIESAGSMERGTDRDSIGETDRCNTSPTRRERGDHISRSARGGTPQEAPNAADRPEQQLSQPFVLSGAAEPAPTPRTPATLLVRSLRTETLTSQTPANEPCCPAATRVVPPGDPAGLHPAYRPVPQPMPDHVTSPIRLGWVPATLQPTPPVPVANLWPTLPPRVEAPALGGPSLDLLMARTSRLAREQAAV